MTAKEQYIKLCKEEETIPVFQQYWWLDAAVGENQWDVVMVEKEGQILGTFPYVKIKKLGMKIITMPRFVNMMGIWIKYPIQQKYQDKLHFEQSITEELIKQLPDFDYFNQSFNYNFTNWLPFYWKGYKQTTRYTYTLPLTQPNSQDLFEDFTYLKRRDLVRSEKFVSVKEDLSIEEFYALHKKTLLKKGKEIDYPFNLLKRLYEASVKHNNGKIICAIDEQGNIHSALFTIWNKFSSYNLIHPIDPDYRNIGSSNLLIGKMISFLSDKTSTFDFEGSMDQSISDSFRRFGAIQKPYFVIYKANTLLGKLYNLLRN